MILRPVLDVSFYEAVLFAGRWVYGSIAGPRLVGVVVVVTPFRLEM